MKNVKILLAGPGTGKTTKVKNEVKKILKENPSTKILVLSFTNATVNDLLSELKEIKVTSENCMTLHSLALKLNHSIDKHILEKEFEEKILKEYAKQLDIEFDELCKLLNCVTFSQMIVDCVAFVKTNPTYAREKIGEIDLLIVDEYQDFNAEERDLIFVVMDYAKETMILGDDDQCIYGFKNADSDGIISLYNHEDTIKIVHENLCYRCPKDVVIAGNNLIGKNKKRIRKEWKVHNKYTGLSIHQTSNQDETNALVLKKVKSIKADSNDSTIMVLSSVNFAVKPIIEHIKADEGIEFTNWWQDKIKAETMQRIWWLRAIFSPHRFVNIMFLLKGSGAVKGKKKDKTLDILKRRLQKGEKEEVLIEAMIKLDLLPKELASFTLDKPQVEDFFKKMKDFESFSKYLSVADVTKNLEKLGVLVTDKLQFDKGKVNFMSIHKSKGLQADHTFILGLVEGIIPNQSDAIDTLEAQRRLFFVGLSRAKKTLTLVSQIRWPTAELFRGRVDRTKFKFVGKKIMKGQASLFIRELNN